MSWLGFSPAMLAGQAEGLQQLFGLLVAGAVVLLLRWLMPGARCAFMFCFGSDWMFDSWPSICKTQQQRVVIEDLQVASQSS